MWKILCSTSVRLGQWPEKAFYESGEGGNEEEERKVLFASWFFFNVKGFEKGNEKL